MTAPAKVPHSTTPAETTWEGLLSTALVGTARRPPPPSLALDFAVGPDASEDAAALLLTEAAVLSAYRRAGRLPGEAPRNLPAPAVPDDRPSCSPTAVEVLELSLSGQVPIPGGVALLAGQWLEAAARVDCRIPARLLPRLLELGSVNPGLQAALRTVVGPRGRWLAGFHDRWGWAGGEPVDDLEAAAPRFPVAPRAERPAILEAVRRADTTRGRDVLASTWKTDPAAERAALLAVLAVELSDGDEPFLEAALDDRSAGVRQVAVDLLARLPASRRAARMAERLRALVRRGDGPLSFAPLEEVDALGRRDGINDAAPAGIGVLAWRLTQLVAGTPLSFWPDELGLAPAETVELAAADGARARSSVPRSPLLLGLESAILAQSHRADTAWAVALFAHRPSAALIATMPPGLAAEQLIGLLGRGLSPAPPVAELFAACPGPWPEPLGRAILDRYRQLGVKATLELQAALPVLAARLDPSALPLVETWGIALTDDQGLRRRVQTLGHALSLRAVIQREFPS